MCGCVVWFLSVLVCVVFFFCDFCQLSVCGFLCFDFDFAVVRVADIIAYLGKDRQDAARVKMTAEDAYAEHEIGSLNAEIINNLVVNIIENSYGKPYIKLDTVHFEALRASKAENYKLIYNEAAKAAHLSDTVRPMMQEMYGQLLDDLRENHTTSPIFTHPIRVSSPMRTVIQIKLWWTTLPA